MRQIRALREATAHRVVAARRGHSFQDLPDLCTRAGLDKRDRDALADAGALKGLANHRHRAQWVIAGVEVQLPLFGHDSPREAAVVLPLPG